MEALDELVDFAVKEIDARASEPGAGTWEPLPSRALLGRVVPACFWASIARNESRAARFTVSVRGRREGDLPFAVPLRLTPEALTELAPAVADSSLDLGVDGDPPEIWGLARPLPFSARLAVLGPAHLLFSLARSVGVVERERFVGPIGHHVEMTLSRLFAERSFPERYRRGLALSQIANAIRADGHGGWFAICGRDANLDSTFPKRIAVLDRQGSQLLAPLEGPQSPAGGEGTLLSRLDLGPVLRERCRSIARAASIDGAAVIDEDLNLLALGAFVGDTTHVDAKVLVEGGSKQVKDFGGGRHTAAASAVLLDHEIASIVVSQDGPITLFAWIARENALGAVERLEWKLHAVSAMRSGPG